MSRQLIDPAFLLFLKATKPDFRYVDLECEVERYASLLALGWSDEQLFIARRIGFPYGAYAREKSQQLGGPQLLEAYVKDCYIKLRAEHVGLTLDQFIQVWCQLAEYRKEGFRLSDLLYLYIKARYSDLSDSEAKTAVRSWPEDMATYLWLRRRGLPAELVRRFFNCPRQKPWYVDRQGEAKYILEALRRGASPDQVVNTLYTRSVEQLALDLRRQQRATEQNT